MNKEVIISVLLPIYNVREEWLRHAVDSILNQTFKDFELICILDAPTDDSERIIREYADKDSRIVILKNESNHGIVYSLNRGLSSARGKYIARMDADDYSYPGRFEKQLKYLIENDCDILATRHNNIDTKDTIVYVCPVIEDSTIPSTLKYKNFMAHPTWMVKKNVYEQLGGYRGIYLCEDYDFLLRAAYGTPAFRLGICDEILLDYRFQDPLNQENSEKQHFIQTLTTCLLQSNYKNLSTIDPEEIRNRVDKTAGCLSAPKFSKNIKRYRRYKQLVYAGRYKYAFIYALLCPKPIRIIALFSIKNEKIYKLTSQISSLKRKATAHKAE